MKIDLDEIEVSLIYLEDWKKIIKELRAAREVVSSTKEMFDLINMDSIPRGYTIMEAWGRSMPEIELALEKYDEATK